jgi:hypothetical protein
MRAFRATGAAVLLSLVLGACQTSPQPSPTSAPSAGAPGPTAAAVAPTQTADPPNVAALFSAAASKLTNATYTFTGTATIGLVQSTISGTATVNGPDSLQALTTTVGGVETTTHATQTAGKRYVDGAGLPWLEAPGTATAHNLGAELLRAAGATVTDAGVEDHAGAQLHRLVTAQAAQFAPIAIVPGAADAEEATATITFYATDTGAPAAATIAATWTQPQGKDTVDASLTVDVQISQLGIQLPITVPEHVWTVFKSSRWHYSLAYPDDYAYSKDKVGDYFDGPVFGGAYAGRTSALGFGLNAIAKGEASYLKKAFAAKSVKNDAFKVGGVQARLLTLTGYNKSLKSKVTLYEAVAVKGGNVYVIGWVAKPGNEAAELATFKELVATFKFT